MRPCLAVAACRSRPFVSASRTARWIALAAWSALVVVAPPTALGQGSLFLRGARAYAEGRYADAAVAFSDAYAADPDPTYLYHLGLALEGAGDLEGALSNYERFLELVPDAPERAEVEASIERVTSALMSGAAEPEPEVEPDPDDGEGPPRSVSHVGIVSSATGRRPTLWPWVLAGGGAVIFVVGAIVGGVALSTHDAAVAEPVQADAVARDADAQTQAAAATALLVIGGLVTIGGVAWGIVDLVLPTPDAEGDDGTEVSARLRLAPGSGSLEIVF